VLAFIAMGWLIGLLVASVVPSGVGLGLGVVALLFASVLVAYGGALESFVWALPLGAAAVCAGMAFRAPPSPTPLAPGVVRMTATVEAVRFRRLSAIATARIERGERLDGGGALAPGSLVDVLDADVPEGSRIAVLGRMQPPLRFRNPSPHPDWPRTYDVAARVRPAEGSRVAVSAAPRLGASLHRARSAVRAGLEATLGPRAAGLAKALVLGEGASLGEEDQDAVRALGLSHVLAVSGLHVAVVVGLAVLALEWMLVRSGAFVDARRVAAALGIPLAIVYAQFAGASPSAVRAAFTACIAFAIVVAGRRPQPIPVLAAAVLFQSVVDPSQARHPGFLLSVISTAALLTSPPMTGKGVAGRMKDAAMLSVRATVATAPLVIWLFGQLPWAGVVANVVLVPVGVALVPLALAHGSIAALSTGAAALTARLVEALAEAFLVSCEALSFEGASAPMPPPTVFQGLAMLVGCMGLLFLRGRARLAVSAVVALALVAGEASLRASEHPRGLLRATVLDIGQGDAILVDLPDGRLMLVDAGNLAPDAGRMVIVPLLAARRRARIDVVVLTHPHPDHFGGLASVLDAVEVTELWDSGQAEDESADGPASLLLRDARRRGIRVLSPAELCGRPRRFGSATAEVLWPCPAYDPGFDPNDNSLVVRLALGSRAFLLTGDLEAHGEAALLAHP
jgi:competence protein ComEC